MFDNLLQLVKENAGDAIINNPAIPNEKNDTAINTTTNSIVDSLKSQIAGGNLTNVLDMFNPNTPANANVNNAVSDNVVTDLVSKLGIDKSQAANIAGSLIPMVMGKLVNKTNDPNDQSFDLNGILGSLGGGNVSGMLGNLGGMFK